MNIRVCEYFLYCTKNARQICAKKKSRSEERRKGHGMKYNIECIREILLTLEESLKLVKDEDGNFSSNNVWLGQLFSQLTPKYTEEDILYSLEILSEAELIDAYFDNGDGLIISKSTFVADITYKGHEFLENVRDSKNWRKMKEIGGQIGSFALSIIGEIAKNYLITSAGNLLLR